MEDLGPEGIIATDNFNRLLGELEGSYIANQDKIWQIKIPQNCQLWIVFEEFDVEPTPNCEKDYFSVQTSKNQPDIKKYCRTLESVTIQRRRRAQLWFHSDSSIQRRGIFARYCFRRISTNSSEQRQTMQLRCDCNLGGSHTRRRRQLQNQGMHVALQMLNCCLASRPSIVNP
ncbi:Cubilin [Geodia barretti]|nr:Cubilin [Geodia barretti]